MANIIPYYVEKDLPFAVSAQLADLPEQAQRDFLNEYNRRAKNLVLSYILHFIFPAHYLYLDKILTQIIFWITFGGFGFWWFIDIFRMPSLVKDRNKEIADECLRYVLHQYKGQHQQTLKTQPTFISTTPQPKQLYTPDFDPMRPSIESLKMNYLVDYNFKTWHVVGETQYDWSNNVSDREFKLVNGTDILHLTVRREGMYVHCHIGSLVNLYSIDTNLDNYISQYQNPPNTITQGDFTFFRENRLEGYAFDKASATPPLRVIAWDFYDANRRFRLRIEQTGRSQFKAVLSQTANEIDFTDILPMG
ncbi:MAG: hypothetical protein OHK0057_11330 [Thermoflexibacter sp.]